MAFPQQRIPLSRESWDGKIGNPKTQENLHPHPAFLQNRILLQTKSARSIKRFRILHGRLAGLPERPDAVTDYGAENKILPTELPHSKALLPPILLPHITRIV